MADFEFHCLNQDPAQFHRLQKLFKPPVIVQQFADKFQIKALPQSLHFARKTFNPWAGFKTDSRSAPCGGPPLRRATTCGLATGRRHRWPSAKTGAGHLRVGFAFPPEEHRVTVIEHLVRRGVLLAVAPAGGGTRKERRAQLPSSNTSCLSASSMCGERSS